jgi:hypothetical protein
MLVPNGTRHGGDASTWPAAGSYWTLPAQEGNDIYTPNGSFRLLHGTNRPRCWSNTTLSHLFQTTLISRSCPGDHLDIANAGFLDHYELRCVLYSLFFLSTLLSHFTKLLQCFQALKEIAMSLPLLCKFISLCPRVDAY